MKLLRILLCILPLIAGGVVRSQVVNLSNFDRNLLHYGIQIGYSQSKFTIDYTEDADVREVMQGVTSYYNPGFHLAVIGDLKVTPYVNLRMAPGLTLINRSINYYWERGYSNAHKNLDMWRSVESVYGEIPVDLKFRSMRWHNYRPYLTTGISYGFDFASLRNNKNNDDQSIVRLNTSDFRYTAGVGFDFYLRYVKFAIEIKMSFGMPNLAIPDDDYYSRAINGMTSRTVMVGFTFEG
ncbi:MAG: PorT family protein [Bacteroidales bacterium]|nr:PorT family protein [Bacteroidales bacterium]